MSLNNKKAGACSNTPGAASMEVESTMQTQDIPEGFCQCGCGGTVGRWERTNRYCGQVRGEFKRFINGHQGRKTPMEQIAGRLQHEDCGFETDCWLWLGPQYPNGYGWVSTMRDGRKRSQVAHRFVYKALIGPIPDGLVLDHLCRVPLCCNPDHLEPVTSAVNSQRGVGAKLTREDVEWIRSQPPEVSNPTIAAKLDVATPTVCNIRNGKAWRSQHDPINKSTTTAEGTAA